MNILTKISRRLRRIVRKPDVKVQRAEGMLRLGSVYGGWEFLDRDYLQNATIVSAGLGVDASFDVEFARRYGATILIVDPTPKAIAHFHDMVARVGQPALQQYVAGGHQPVDAYPMDWTDGSHFRLAPYALWNEAGTMRFFMPSDTNHVSHSLINFQHGYGQESDHIEVETIRLSDLLARENIAPPALMKLDIEGAEIEVLQSMIADGIRPRQLLIEYDELIIRTKKAMERVNGSIAMLVANGYQCRHYDGDSNFLFELA
jgi:FkbM family methyltransferase